MASQKETEQTLKELRDLNYAFDQTTIVAITNIKGIITYVNDKFCQISGYQKQELIGKTHRIINSDYHPPSFFQKMWEIILSGKIWQGEVKNRAKDGTQYWVKTVIVPFLDAVGKPYQFVSIRTDITDRMQVEAELLERKALYKLMADNTKDLTGIFDLTGRIKYISASQEAVLGYSSSALIGKSIIHLIHPQDVLLVQSKIKSIIEEKQVEEFEIRLKRSDATWGTYLTRGLPITDKQGKVESIVACSQDISETKWLEQAFLEITKGITSETGDSFFYSLVTHLTQALGIEMALIAELTPNKQLEVVACYANGKRMEEFIYDISHTPCEEVLGGSNLHYPEKVQEIYPNNQLFKQFNVQSYMGTPLIGANGTVIGVLAIMGQRPLNRIYLLESILTIFSTRAAAELERRLKDREIRYMAYHDTLTGLPNRRQFQEQLKHDLSIANQTNSYLAIGYVDMDFFKYINDSLGHSFGDLLIKHISQRMKEILSDIATIYHMGGDEFIIVSKPLKDREQIHEIISTLMKQFEIPFHVEEQEIYVTPSIGISFYPTDGLEIDTLIRKSDRAMYAAKELGRNTYQLYSQQWDVKYSRRLKLEKDLRTALEKEEFALFYQPKVNIKSNTLVGMEALIRWFHPTEGLIPPTEFIPIAEETGLILPIGKWVLHTACRQVKQWIGIYNNNLSLAVNLSARQFKREDITEEIARVMRETKFQPENLIIEITESLSMDNAEKTMSLLQQLRQMGVSISIDDFGTGYSSLSYLKRFPVNSLKIDRSFINDIATNLDDASIVQTIVMLAHHLGIKVVAEGAETKEQLDFLLSIDCDEGQGYYFSKPVSAEEFEYLFLKAKIDNGQTFRYSR